MDWFPDILQGPQSTSPTERKYSLLTKDMPYFLENPNYAENIRNPLNRKKYEAIRLTFL